MEDNRIKLTYDDIRYHERLTLKARFIVMTADDRNSVRESLNSLREDICEDEYNDMRKLCNMWWASLK